MRDVAADAAQRSFEYDSMTDLYSRFLAEDILPAAEHHLATAAIGGATAGQCRWRISSDPARRAACGVSSGGICAFNCSWQRPDLFGMVISHVGSFVNLRGGHNYPWLVRNTAPRKAIRKVFLQSGQHDMDRPRGNWALANQAMAAALDYAGYNLRWEFGEGVHSLRHGGVLFPETLRWMFGKTQQKL
jgi:enterochelin esterase-like enzyme